MAVVNVRKLKEIFNAPSLIYGVLRDGVGDKAKPLEITKDGEVPITGFVVRTTGGVVSSGIITSDVLVQAGPHCVYWITLCCDAALNIEIVDGLADGFWEPWGQTYPANCYAHYIFDPPIELSTGLYIDITTTGNAKVIVGYI